MSKYISKKLSWIEAKALEKVESEITVSLFALKEFENIERLYKGYQYMTPKAKHW